MVLNFIIGKLLLRRKKLVLFVVFSITLSSITLTTTAFSTSAVKNKLFLQSLNTFLPDARVRTWSKMNFTMYQQISRIVAESQWSKKIEFSPRIITTSGILLLSKGRRFVTWQILGLFLNSDFGSNALRNTLVNKTSTFSLNHFNTSYILAPLIFCRKYNVSLGDTVNVSNNQYTIAAIYNSSLQFHSGYESSSDYPPLIFNLSATQKMLNFSPSEFNTIDFQFKTYSFSDLSEYKSAVLTFLASLSDKLDLKKIAVVIELGKTSIYKYQGSLHPSLVLECNSPKYDYIQKIETGLFKLAQEIVTGINVLSIAISFVVTATVIIMLITRLKKELSILRVLGVTRGSIVLQLFLFSLLIGVVATTLGILISFAFYPFLVKPLYFLIGIKSVETTSELDVFNTNLLINIYEYILLSSVTATIPGSIIIVSSTIIQGLQSLRSFKIRKIMLNKYFIILSCLLAIISIIQSLILIAYPIYFYGPFVSLLILWFIWPLLIGFIITIKLSKKIVVITQKFVKLSKVSVGYLNAGLVRNMLVFVLIVLILTFTLLPLNVIGSTNITMKEEVNRLVKNGGPFYVESRPENSNLSIVYTFSEIKYIQYTVGLKLLMVNNLKIYDNNSRKTLYLSASGSIAEMEIASQYTLNYGNISDVITFSDTHKPLNLVLTSIRSNPKNIVISKILADKMDKHINDTISIEIVSSSTQTKIELTDLRIVSIIDQVKGGLLGSSQVIFFGLRALENISSSFLSSLFFIVKVSPEHYHETICTLREYTKRFDMTIVNDPEELEKNINENEAFLLFLKIIFAVPYSMILLALSFIYYISLDSRKKEISIVKVLGASQIDVLLYVSLEYILLLFFALISGIIGIMGASLVSHIANLTLEGHTFSFNIIWDTFNGMSLNYILLVIVSIASILLFQIYITTMDVYKKETTLMLREM